MVHVKENIAGFFRFKHTHAEETSADDLERIHQNIFHILEFKFRQFFHMDLLEDLRRYLLCKLSVIIPEEGGEQRRMVVDCLLQRLAEMFHIKHLFVHPHHGEKVVHRGVRCLQLVVHHIGLLGCKRMILFQGLLVALVCRDAVLVCMQLFI